VPVPYDEIVRIEKPYFVRRKVEVPVLYDYEDEGAKD